MLINCSLSFVMPDNAGNIGQICFFHWKDCLFSQKFVFSTISQVIKNFSYKLYSNGKISLRTLANCSLRFVPLDKGGKMGQQLLWLRIQLFSEKFVFEMILSLAQLVSKYLVDPYKMLLDICHVQYYEKIRSKNFFHWKGCFFSKVCVFNNLLGS